MGMAGLIFEPRPPNFENQYNFGRCLNGIKTFFSISLLVSDFQKISVSAPSILKHLLDLTNLKCKTKVNYFFDFICCADPADFVAFFENICFFGWMKTGNPVDIVFQLDVKVGNDLWFFRGTRRRPDPLD